MPRTAIPVASVGGRAGVVIGSTSGAEINGDVANGHEIQGNDGRVFLHARNSAAGTITIAFNPVAGVAGFTMPPRQVTRNGVGDLFIGPFPLSMFGDTVSIDVGSANWRLRAYRLQGTPSRGANPPTPGTAGSRVVLPITAISRSGIDVTAGVSEVSGDAANDHFFANDGNVLLLARATSVDVTHSAVADFTLDGQAVADNPCTVPIATPVKVSGPYPPSLYTQDDGHVYINVAASTIRLRALWLPYQD